MKYCVILLSFLCIVPVSKGKVHIEPYGNIGGSYSSSISSGPLFMNYALGARLGYQFLSVSTGLDLFWTHYGTGTSSNVQHVEVHYSSEPNKGFNQASKSVSFHHSEVREPFQPFSLGAFVALDLPLLFNTYGTVFYTFGKKTVSHQGYGIKAGLSYLSSFYVQLNLEFQWAHYTCMEEAQCSSSRSFNVISAALSLSVPFSTDFFNFGREEVPEDDTEDSENDTSSSDNF